MSDEEEKNEKTDISASWRGKVDKLIFEDLEKGEENLKVIVVLEELSEENVEELKKNGLKNVKILELIDGVAGTVFKEDLEKIAILPFVKEVLKDVERVPLREKREV